MIKDILLFLAGILVGGAITAISAKAFGFFNKQVKSLESKV